MSRDKEVEAIAGYYEAVSQMDYDTQDRMLRYLCQRHNDERAAFESAVHPRARHE